MDDDIGIVSAAKQNIDIMCLQEYAGTCMENIPSMLPLKV